MACCKAPALSLNKEYEEEREGRVRRREEGEKGGGVQGYTGPEKKWHRMSSPLSSSHHPSSSSFWTLVLWYWQEGKRSGGKEEEREGGDKKGRKIGWIQ